MTLPQVFVKMTQSVIMNNEDYAPLTYGGNKTPTKQSPRFLNPPQPHMCIHVLLEGCQNPCYINVMSWSKVGLPLRPDDPVPLWGGIQVPCNDRTLDNAKHTPIVFAVMANPEFLKEMGKTAKNEADRAILIDLMLEFVEAMNPNFKFTRQVDVLRNRDLIGELKDIWAAVRGKRDVDKRIAHSLTHAADENCQPCQSIEGGDVRAAGDVADEEEEEAVDLNNTDPVHS